MDESYVALVEFDTETEILYFNSRWQRFSRRGGSLIGQYDFQRPLVKNLTFAPGGDWVGTLTASSTFDSSGKDMMWYLDVR